MAFDAFAPIPAGYETVPITTPLQGSSTGNQFGGTIGYVGQPSNPDPSQVIAEKQQSQDALLARYIALHGTPPPAPVPAPAGPQAPPPVAIDGVMGGLAGSPNLPAPVPASAPPAAPQTPQGAPRGGGGAKPGDLEKEIVATGKRGEAAIDTSQGAKVDAADALARAHDDLRVQQQADAQELKDRHEQNRLRNEQLDKDDAANLAKARDYVIPAFWDSHEGALAGSAVAIAMGGIAQGILGGPNGAYGIVKNHVDTYFDKQKAKVDNLYRYAEQQGKLDNQTRIRYAQELIDLKDQHSAVQQSLLSHIASVEKQNTGNIARADIDALKVKLQEDILKQRGESREQRAKLALMAAQTNAANANAAESRAKAAGTTSKEDKAVVYDDKGNFLGHVTSGKGGAQAFSNQDANYTRAEHALVALAEDIRLHGDRVFTPEAVKRRNTLKENADIGVATVSPLGKTDEAMKKESGSIGAGGSWSVMGANPEAVSRKIEEIRSQRERFRSQGLVGYGGMRGADGSHATAPEGASAPKPNTIVRMKDGTTQEFDSTGKRVK